MCRGVLSQSALARCAPDSLQSRAVERQSVERILGAASDQDLLAGLVEFVQARPFVADDRGPAGCGFEQTTRRAPAHSCRGLSRHIERQARGREERGTARRRHS